MGCEFQFGRECRKQNRTWEAYIKSGDHKYVSLLLQTKPEQISKGSRKRSTHPLFQSTQNSKKSCSYVSERDNNSSKFGRRL